jgi:hypothetical protein
VMHDATIHGLTPPGGSGEVDLVDGGRSLLRQRQLSPPLSVTHRPPVVEPMTRPDPAELWLPRPTSNPPCVSRQKLIG